MEREKKSGADLEIDKIKKAISDIAKKVKMGRIGKKSNIQKEISGKLKKLKTRAIIPIYYGEK